ncbi:MAG: hypothetical protein E7049_02530 [Lentisphaerae bacterium]|jgi:hypothetical protein|nr:hypothetical protein [Lentisphaerota bacterium]
MKDLKTKLDASVKKDIRLAVAAFMAMASVTALASAPAVSEADRHEVNADTSLSAGYVVPANATLTVRPGVFYPEGGPLGVDEVVWKNVKLTDIASFTGKISAGSGDQCYWQEAGCYFVTTNEVDGSVQCQLQMNGQGSSATYGFVMQYRQEGLDVKARIVKGRYMANYTAGQMDMTTEGGDLDVVTNTLYSVAYKVRALADLGFVLREGADVSAAPLEIVFTSTDTSGLDEETYGYLPCIKPADSSAGVTVARNLRVEDIVGMSGDVSLKVEQSGHVVTVPWAEAQSYQVVVTNGGTTVKMYLLAEVDENNSKRRAGAVVQFDQVNADVQCRVIWAGHQYKGSGDSPNYAAIDSPFGPGFGQDVQTGVALDVTDVVGENGVETVGKIAIRNLKVRFRPASHIVGDYGECILREDGWVKLWDDVSLSDATLGPSSMAVNKDGVSNWSVAFNYLRTAQAYTTQSYYQWLRGNTLYSIRFLMQEQFGDVYAKIASAHYNYNGGTHPEYVPGFNPGTSDGTGFSFVAVTNVVGASVDGAHDTLMVNHLTIDMPAKKHHTVTVESEFNPGPSPIRLDSVKLALAPAEAQEMDLRADIRGCGAVGVSGLGSVTIAADLPATIGLDVDSGSAVISADRVVGGPVNVRSGAALEFRLGDAKRPSLSAEFFTIEPGAEIVLSSDRRPTDVPKAGETCKIVRGCRYAPYALEGVTCRTSGNMGDYAARVFVDDDGDISVNFRRTRYGFSVVIR